MSTPISGDAGRRQADYFREVLQQELVESQQRIGQLSASLSVLIARDEAPITVRRMGRALKAAVADRHRLTAMLMSLDRSYPVPVAAVAS